MIFALLDFRDFRRGTGRYADSPTSRLFACFEDGLPAEVVALLETGDTIFTSDLRSGLAWMIRYITGSHFSHIAMVLEPGKIQEMTLQGVVVRTVEDLARPHVRIMPVHGPYTPEQRRSMGKFLAMTRHARYATKQTLLDGAKILLCYYPSNFRPQFIMDIALLLIIFDLISLEMLRFPVLTWLLIPYLAIVGYFYATWRFRLRAVPATPMPDTLLFGLLAMGGVGFADGAALRRKTRTADGSPLDIPDIIAVRALPSDMEQRNGR